MPHLASDDSDLWYGSLCKGVEQFSSVPDNSAVFLRRSRQEARHVDERNDRDVEGVAEADETGSLHRRINIQTTCTLFTNEMI